MQQTVNQRIKEIIIYTGLSLNAFANNIGIAQTSLRECVKNGTEPKYSTLNKILIANPSISAEWLLRGEGDMLRSNNIEDFKNSEEYQEYKKMEDLFIEFNRQTDVLLEDKDRTIRELQLKLVTLKAERIVEERRT